MKIKTVFDNNIEYPETLKNIANRPRKLYVLGNMENLRRNCITIIGCRDCTAYGANSAKRISYELAKNNYTIVSSLSKGIDSYAHIGALKANGRTIAVLGNGLNKIYPAVNRELAKQILYNNGTLVSEYSFNDVITKENFIKRNRILSGLSENIIIVEAKRKSGTMLTVNFALEQGKNIYCVPGNVNQTNSFGTNELIKNGAQILYSFPNCNII